MMTEPDNPSDIQRRTTESDLMIIASLWLIGLFLVNPLGEFPLNDDWSFGITVKYLLENGDFHPADWVSMPLLTNVIWGALFCLPTGFSFTALRMSTLVMSLLGLVMFYLLLRDMKQSRGIALIMVLTLAFNPIYCALSNTFMTDVPYTTMAILAAFFFARNLRTSSNVEFTVATILAVVATLSRQLALSIPLAFAVTLVVTQKISRQNILRAVIPVISSVTALLILEHWLSVTGRMPSIYHARTSVLFSVLADPGRLISTLADNTFTCLIYLGVFLLPILLWESINIIREHGRKAVSMLIGSIAAVTAFGALCCLAIHHGQIMIMPFSRNILTRFGIGPLTLRDTYIMGLDHVPVLPTVFWIAVTMAGLAGAGIIIALLAFRARPLIKNYRAGIGENEVSGVFFLLVAIIYLLPLLVGGFFDRYFIPAMPFLMAGLAGIAGKSAGDIMTSRFAKFAVITMLALFALFSICATRDYLGWNRIRWEALYELMDKKQVSPTDIDGGFEFNGLYTFDPLYRENSGKSWWWVRNDEYQITFGPLPGCKVVMEYSYYCWLIPHTQKILVLQKDSKQ